MTSTPLQEELVSLEQQLKTLCAKGAFDRLLVLISEHQDFIRGLDVSTMNQAEKQSFISFSNTHHEVMLSVTESRKEALDELKKRNAGKKKIKQYKGVKNSAG